MMFNTGGMQALHWWKIFYFPLLLVGLVWSQNATLAIPLRLQGPLSSNGSGRVEIFHSGQWGTICDDSWDINDTTVVCRQLGYKYGVRALRGGDVPDGSGQIWLDSVSCTGIEQNLTSCSHDGWGNHNCDHHKDAGVECSSTAIPLRLQGPSSENGTGRVEVFYRGQWGTICDDRWDINDVRVVCRQLGFKYAVRALQGGQAPRGSGQIWLDNVHCSGSEKNLTSCSHIGWGNHNCGHYEDAGVDCSSAAIPLRLQGPSSVNGIGRVEIFYRGQWGTICNDRWDINDAKVVCVQLGYINGVRASQGGQVPIGSGQIWLNGVDCTGKEQNLTRCSHKGWGNHNCNHLQDAGVECSSSDVDECSRGLDNCHSNSRCINTIGSFSCICNHGYKGNGVHCTDINECLQSIDNCHSNAYCTNIDGSFLCTCGRGYTGNGTVCQDIDECSLSIDDCHQNSSCINIDGSFWCICDSRFAGNTALCKGKSIVVRLQGLLSR